MTMYENIRLVELEDKNFLSDTEEREMLKLFIQKVNEKVNQFYAKERWLK